MAQQRSITRRENRGEAIQKRMESGAALYEEMHDRIVRMADGVYRVPSRSKPREFHLVYTGETYPRFCGCKDFEFNNLDYCAHCEAAATASEEGCVEFFIRAKTNGLGITNHELYERRADGSESVIGSSIEINDMYELMFCLQDAVSSEAGVA